MVDVQTAAAPTAAAAGESCRSRLGDFVGEATVETSPLEPPACELLATTAAAAD